MAMAVGPGVWGEGGGRGQGSESLRDGAAAAARRWPSNSNIHVEQLSGATVVQSAAHMLKLELAGTDDFGRRITLKGTGSLNPSPGISCDGGDDEAETDECDLGVRYHVRHSWPGGEDGELLLDRWEDDREISVTFHEAGQAVRRSVMVENAAVDQVSQDCSHVPCGTVIRFDLIRDHGGVSGGAGVPKVVFQLVKPTASKPRIVCHKEYPPSPPPPPKPPSPSPAPMPPPPPRTVRAMSGCHLGGHAIVVGSHSEGSYDNLRISIEPARWSPNYVLTLALSSLSPGFSSDVTVVRAARARPFSPLATSLALFSPSDAPRRPQQSVAVATASLALLIFPGTPEPRRRTHASWKRPRWVAGRSCLI